MAYEGDTTYASNYSSSMRESIADTITNIAPIDCILTNLIAKGKAKAKYEQWQEDTLTAPSTALASVEGENVTPGHITYPTNAHNYTQYSEKTFKLADVMEYVDKVGRASEQAYQKGRHLAMLKTQVEFDMLNTAAESAGSTSAGRASCGVKGFITTNLTTNTTVTTSVLTETAFNDSMQLCWDVGGNPDTVLVGGKLKRQISAFNGNNKITVNTDDGDKKVINTVDFYEGDFGTVRIYASRFLQYDYSSTYLPVLILEKKMWEQLILMPYRSTMLAKNGPSTTWMIDVEYTLKCRSQKANAYIKNCYAA